MRAWIRNVATICGVLSCSMCLTNIFAQTHPQPRSLNQAGRQINQIVAHITNIEELGPVRSIAFSPDNTLIAASSAYETVSIWKWRENKRIQTLQKLDGVTSVSATTALQFSPNGRFLAACHSRAENGVSIRVWRTDLWTVAADIGDASPGNCSAIGFTSDGKYLVRATRRSLSYPADTVIVYETTGWKPVRGINTLPFQPQALAIGGDSTRMAVGGTMYEDSGAITEQVRIYSVPEIEPQFSVPRTVSGHYGQIAWSADGKHLALVGSRGWDIGANSGHGGYSGANENFALYDGASGKQLASELIGNDGVRLFLQFTPTGKYLLEGSGEEDVGLRIWDVKHTNLLWQKKQSVLGLAVSKNGKFVATGQDKKVSIIELLD